MTFEMFSDEEKAAYEARKAHYDAEFERLHPRPKPRKLIWWRLGLVIAGFVVLYQILARLAWLAAIALFGTTTATIVIYLIGCLIVAPLGGYFAAKLSFKWTNPRS